MGMVSVTGLAYIALYQHSRELGFWALGLEGGLPYATLAQGIRKGLNAPSHVDPEKRWK